MLLPAMVIKYFLFCKISHPSHIYTSILQHFLLSLQLLGSNSVGDIRRIYRPSPTPPIRLLAGETNNWGPLCMYVCSTIGGFLPGTLQDVACYCTENGVACDDSAGGCWWLLWQAHAYDSFFILSSSSGRLPAMRSQ